jgi:hypothetical protein
MPPLFRAVNSCQLAGVIEARMPIPSPVRQRPCESRSCASAYSLECCQSPVSEALATVLPSGFN